QDENLHDRAPRRPARSAPQLPAPRGDRLRRRLHVRREARPVAAARRRGRPFGPPPAFVAGFGPRMVGVAGEVADGFIAHPFNSRRSLLERVVPALECGLAQAGRTRADVEVVCATLVVTADREEEFERVALAARKQLAFYGSTPAYRQTLDVHGWGALHEELNRLSKAGRWDDTPRHAASRSGRAAPLELVHRRIDP